MRMPSGAAAVQSGTVFLRFRSYEQFEQPHRFNLPAGSSAGGFAMSRGL